jgi:hypothetical protein
MNMARVAASPSTIKRKEEADEEEGYQGGKFKLSWNVFVFFFTCFIFVPGT